jgi:glycosyltransferase involved in cell wall biosynthesis
MERSFHVHRTGRDAAWMARSMSVPRVPVSVVVPVRNEERNLAECLSRLSRFAEVVVVDSGSTDRTEDIARAAGVTYLLFTWNGTFPKKRNWVLLNHDLAGSWVLFLDADEYVTDAFVDELANVLPTTSHVAFWIEYTNHFMGQRLRHGPPMRKLALLKQGSGLYERIPEQSWSALDMEVHEHPVVSGTTGLLRTPVEHNDYKNLHAYLARHNEYSSWEAARWAALSVTPQSWNHLTPAQRRKYGSLTRWWLAPAYFLYSYVWKLGFLDGTHGFAFAFLKAAYFYQIRLKIHEGRIRGFRS